MEGGPLGEHLGQGLGVLAGDVGRVEHAEALLQHLRALERPFQGDLLVEDHADQQGQRAGGEQLVRLGVLREVQAHCRHAPSLPRTARFESVAFPASMTGAI
jgi:hypothetical protein